MLLSYTHHIIVIKPPVVWIQIGLDLPHVRDPDIPHLDGDHHQHNQDDGNKDANNHTNNDSHGGVGVGGGRCYISCDVCWISYRWGFMCWSCMRRLRSMCMSSSVCSRMCMCSSRCMCMCSWRRRCWCVGIVVKP